MKFSNSNWISGCTAILFSALIILPGCKNSKKETPAANGNDTTSINTTNPDTTKTNLSGKTGKRTGRISAAVPTIDKSSKMQTDTKGYYNYTETLPAYPGGQSSLEDYISKNLEYPQEALDNNIEGTVTIKFTIDENGKVGNVQTTGTALGHGLDEAAMKVVSGMPNWTPGMINGKKVKAWYSLPLTFKIEE